MPQICHFGFVQSRLYQRLSAYFGIDPEMDLNIKRFAQGSSISYYLIGHGLFMG